MASYFENFPIVRYGNTYARDITSRVGITKEVLKNQYVFYPYEIKNNMRADSLAQFYYDDVLNNWIFYIANDIVDPYYQWYNSTEELNRLIETKYGSLSNALRQIHHWEVNWLGDEREISPSVYNSFIVNVNTGVDQKKYWTPIFDTSGFVVSYKRKKFDLQVSVNQLVSLDTTITAGNSFFNEERVIQTSGSVVVASGFVNYKAEDNDSLVLKNITGNFSNASIIVGEDSNTQASFTTIKVLSRSFPAQESEYWSPVSFYDYEIGENEKRRTINVIDNKFTEQIEQNLISVFK
jgi:hypothetical protein